MRRNLKSFLVSMMAIAVMIVAVNGQIFAQNTTSTQSNKPKSESVDQKEEMVRKLAEAMENRYVFPEIGKKMAESLRTSLEENKYANIDDRKELAKAMTKQLRGICKDLHLRIRSTAPRPPKRSGNRFVDNHGFVKAEMLKDGVGYLRFDYFSSHPGARETAAAAMNFLANSKAIIFDLRRNGGGNPKMIAFLTSYIVDKKTHLNSFYNRPSDTTTESWTLDKVPGKKLGGSVPVYVLTSRRTFSGAEEFSYNLKHLNRGTIIGEITGGGAHPVRMEQLPGGFFVSVPFARAINPITKKNWEGVGVVPHVEVEKDQALEKALSMATKGISLVNNSAAEPDKMDDGLFRRIRGEAREAMQNQEFANAEKLFKKIIKAGKSNTQDHFNYGYCLHAAGKLDEALKYHQLATKSEQLAPIATYNIACVYSLKKEKNKAFKALNKAVELGFGSADQLENDTDMDNLRSDPRFKKLIDSFDQ